jgi:hypothetical protein
VGAKTKSGEIHFGSQTLGIKKQTRLEFILSKLADV